ncbi:Septal ring factor EnvC, activator of murein hydrolases AmiA and AmiB [Xylanibacter ruminicola]|uniref:Septal ring factor EnvC, activator of murein hydrolases AmiA and AmiB n=2 Tax=Xylanibacter ruminicola TaxID=839 RepID=A0A1M6RXE6_XYLRU|nr:peptidoglycan DD-metalloendopeptidase family protein [Xylanibacter ruminicola]SHK37156.1 Septal ring factor EnvC, activator of murein hydrolases AmiA and AmiB [Xylanibacter ruminicola]
MMNRVFRCNYIVMVLAALISFSSPAMAQQAKKTSVQKRTTTTAKKKTATKKVTTKNTATTKQPVTVNSLKDEQQRVRKQIAEQQRKLQANERDVKKRLQNLLIINNEIADKRKSIDTIRNDINRLDGDIHTLEVHMKYLEGELAERKQRFIKSMRYMHRNRNMQSQLMFIFSAKNLSQMYRRLRFVREYAIYQQNQAEAVKSMKVQVGEAYDELTDTKKQKNDLLVKDERERRSLEGKQVEQQKMVTSLQKQQKTIQSIIEQQKKRDAELNAQIDRLIAQEIARAKARAEAEAKRKAAEAEAKRKAEELARKKAAAEAARKENERRIAEAKAKEEKAKAEARAAAKKNAEEKAAAERAAAEAEHARLAAERKAAADAKAHEKEVAEAKKAESVYTVSSEDRQLSGNFESNRGRLPMPITGAYRIVNHFGVNHVTDVKGHVTLDKKGIDIKGQPGAAVRCIFDGEVSAVFSYAGTTVVIVRHGSYLSVYCDLASVSVSRGQKVSTRQTLGRVGAEGMMQFQLRHGSAKLNPEGWLAR